MVLSSHLVQDLERVCNHLILLSGSRVRLCADIDDVLGAHRVLVGPRRSTAELERLFTVVKATQTERQSRVLARLDGPVLDPAWEVSEVGLEDIILAYMSRTRPLRPGRSAWPEAPHDLPHLEAAPHARHRLGRRDRGVRRPARADRPRHRELLPHP